MKATYRLENPDDMDATLTVTMSVAQWRELKGQLASGHPSWKFSEAIGKLIEMAHKHFYESVGPTT